MSDEPVVPDPATHARRSRSTWLAVGAVVVVLVTIGALAVWRSGSSSSAADTGDAPRFVDDTTGSGIDHSYEGAYEHFVGGGVAAFDCDDNGLADVYLAGGTEPASLHRNRSEVGGALRFGPLPSSVTDLTAVTGAYPLDIDSDGLTDLAVLRRGANVMLRGLGDCRFEDATEQLGLDGGDAWTTAFSATWEGTNALPTLAFGNYRTLDEDGCDDSQLVRPTSTGDGYDVPIALTPGYCTLSMLFSDWDRSGRRDLRVSNDRNYYRDGQEQLWRIAPGEQPRGYTEADGWRPVQIWGMGIASQDLTGDGHPEVFLTSQGDNKLQTLENGPAQPTFKDMALKAGVTAQRPYVGDDVLPSTAWHPEFEDVNNDGLVDLFVSKGNVEAQPDYATRDPSNLLIGQPDGTFMEGGEAAGIVGYDRARGASLVDLNLDGMLDLVVVHREANVSLWRNVGSGDADQTEPMGHWIAVELGQPAPNVDAVGAWVEIKVGERTVVREVTVGGGHAGGKSGWIHAGLGEADQAEVRVQWPDGETGPWMTVGADQIVTIERDATEATPWQLGE
ncbi:MAG TPA: CRTAC1 family protein [Ilumatobacteraceae bacterium]|nr:CRTAC1 family protein [Ilumatobacteraceae bacterium]